MDDAKHLKKWIFSGAVSMLLVLLAGCQANMVRPKAPVGAIPVTVSTYHPDASDMPMGSFVPKGSSLVVHRAPSAAAIGIGRLLGGVGTAVAVSTADGNAKEAAPTVNGLGSIDLKELAAGLLSEKQAQDELGQYLSFTPQPKKGPRYEVASYLFIQVAEEDRVQISLITRVTERDKQGAEGWVGQYIRHIPKFYKTAEFQPGVIDTERLRKSIHAAMGLSFDVMVADLNGELGQAVEPEVKVSSPDILWLSFGQWTGSFVGRMGGNYNIVRSNCSAGDPACFGLHILDFSQARIQKYVGG